MSTIVATNIQSDTIKNSGGTTAMTVNSNGTMTPSQMVIASFRIADHVTFSAQELITNWTTLSAPHTTLGASMTHSSGIFTFPHTGKFLIQAQFQCQASGGNRTYAGGQIKYSSDSGNSYSKLTRSLNGIWTDGGWSTSFCQSLIEITNVSTQKVAFHVYVQGNTSLYTGDNGTQCTFQQVG